MLDMGNIADKEKVTKKRQGNKRLDEIRQSRLEAYRETLRPLFSNVEDVQYTVSESHILVKHDGVFDLVELSGGQATCLEKGCLERFPELKAWWDEFFD